MLVISVNMKLFNLGWTITCYTLLKTELRAERCITFDDIINTLLKNHGEDCDSHSHLKVYLTFGKRL